MSWLQALTDANRYKVSDDSPVHFHQLRTTASFEIWGGCCKLGVGLSAWQAGWWVYALHDCELNKFETDSQGLTWSQDHPNVLAISLKGARGRLRPVHICLGPKTTEKSINTPGLSARACCFCVTSSLNKFQVASRS